jgi:SAM-dependent methyltransferase
MAEWFASWFGSPHYRRLYAHRDESEASRFVDALLARLRPAAAARVLDLGCGTGRHARRLAAKGYDVTGLDLASESIDLAKAHERRGLHFARHDMRVPFGAEKFDWVFNLFTSFGYFERAEEHLAVLANVTRSLKAGGRLVLDYINVRHAEAHLTRHETIDRDGIRYRISRWLETGHIVKQIAIETDDGTVPPVHVERVARFSLEDFKLMFALQGLKLEQIYGDYGLGAFDLATSPRLILVAARNEDRAKADYLRDRCLRMRLSVSGETPRYEASIR